MEIKLRNCHLDNFRMFTYCLYHWNVGSLHVDHCFIVI